MKPSRTINHAHGTGGPKKPYGKRKANSHARKLKPNGSHKNAA